MATAIGFEAQARATARTAFGDVLGDFRMSGIGTGDGFARHRAAAMIDRLVHYAEVASLKGDSYHLKGRDLG